MVCYTPVSWFILGTRKFFLCRLYTRIYFHSNWMLLIFIQSNLSWVFSQIIFSCMWRLAKNKLYEGYWVVPSDSPLHRCIWCQYLDWCLIVLIFRCIHFHGATCFGMSFFLSLTQKPHFILKGRYLTFPTFNKKTII